MKREAQKYVGSHLGQLGPYFGGARKAPGQQGAAKGLYGLLAVEDLFARLCRKYGTAELLARFSPMHGYLGDGRTAPLGLREPAPCFEAVLAANGGRSADCAARHASCEVVYTIADIIYV